MEALNSVSLPAGAAKCDGGEADCIKCYMTRSCGSKA